IRVVPRYRGAVSARFVAVREHPATLRIVMPVGAPAEIGASVTAEDEKSFVGNDGAVFIRSLHPGMMLPVDTGDGPCHVRVDAVPDEMLPVIGPLTCVP
ncbi:fimbrial biogenesis outer membrane usher protein, partial [Staphylococcus haemolyticus]